MSEDCPICQGTGKLDLGEMTIKEYIQFKRDAGYRVFLAANRFLETSIDPTKQEAQE